MSTKQAYERELARLREELDVLRSREVRPDDMGVAGRVALTRLRDTDYPELVKAVEAIPSVYEQEGYWAALAYCRTHVRSLLDAILVADPRTPDLVRTQHRVHMLLDEGQADVLMRRDQAGVRSRMEFLEAVERWAYALSVKAAFAHGTDTPAGLVPPTFSGGPNER